MQLHLQTVRLHLRIGGAADQLSRTVVVDFPDARRHDLPEQEVDRVHDFAAAAEVGRQIDPLSRPPAVSRCILQVCSTRFVLLQPVALRAGLIAQVFLQKQIGLSQPEPVNALFDISYHEAVGYFVRIRFTRYHAQNRFLNKVDVLILVDEDLCILIAQLEGKR